MRLGDLIGQDTGRTALLRAIERGHLAHAYLFDGPPGVGKRGAATGWRWRSTARPRRDRLRRL
jgi:DNA polymerase-3 subunit delta'